MTREHERQTSLTSKLDGQVAWITGAGRGIGRATAFALARRGARVAVTARTRSEVENVAHELPGQSKAESFVCDVSDWQSVTETSKAISSTLGIPEILVNNAGMIGPLGKSWESPPHEWLETIAINLVGAYHCARAVLPGMISRGRGFIVNVSSVAATLSLSNWTAYAASKAGLDSYTRSLASELKNTGVQVFAIYPGVVKTAMVERLLAAGPQELPARRRQYFEQLASEGSLFDPEQVGRTIAWLVSGAGIELNGSVLDFQKETALLEQATRELDQLK
jgi:NAD(P)-dependent dehydrogenase (short-subunit alcohol dehydrogenase family)